MKSYTLALLLTGTALSAAPPYRIARATSPIVIDGKLDEAAWRDATPVGDFVFNWWKEGPKDQTVAKLLWDDENLYVSWYAHDKHISASVTQRHGPVSKDDCVEIFISPNPQKIKNYYTFEINAIGTMLNRCRTDWWTGPPTWEPEGMQYRTSFHGLSKKDESADDDHWVVEAAIPFRNFAKDAAHTPPRDGDVWRLNLHRLGGVTNPQQSSWSPILTARSFHTPEAFGAVQFVTGSNTSSNIGGNRAAEGRAIYNKTCTTCHGLDGTAGDRAPALAAERRYLRNTDQELTDTIKKGIPGTLMPPMGLSDEEVSKVVAYIRSLRSTASDEQVAGDIQKGEAIFRGKGGCADCHMVRGRGGLSGPDLSNIAAERKLIFLKDSLTKPQPAIPRGFQPVVATTASGQRIEGLVKNENNFSLQVLDRDAKLHLLLREELRDLRYETKSWMPADYGQRLADTELQDLLAFLSKQVRSTAPRGRRGR